MSEITIIDACMGIGKTSAMINMINGDKKKRYLYVTPLLSEVDRIEKACGFEAPKALFDDEEKVMTKKEGLRRLLEEGKNIVTTHALFKIISDEILELCKEQEYVLIIDEVIDVVEEYKIKPQDLEDLLKLHAHVGEDHLLHWNTPGEEYTGEKFAVEKQLCDLGCLAVYKDAVLIQLFPIKIFQAFKKSYVLTYMFYGQMQRYYYDFWGLKYNFAYVKGNSPETYELTNEKQEYPTPDRFKDLISICDKRRLNNIGDKGTALSKLWYKRAGKNKELKQLKNNLHTYYMRGVKTKSEESLWTTFKDYKKYVSDKGYAKGFLSCNIRAANEYKKAFNLAYLINFYMNPCVKEFFVDNGIKIDEDVYSLSVMLQWIWRSAIRDGNHINIYLPSSRMRGLLLKWLNNEMEVSA